MHCRSLIRVGTDRTRSYSASDETIQLENPNDLVVWELELSAGDSANDEVQITADCAPGERDMLEQLAQM